MSSSSSMNRFAVCCGGEWMMCNGCVKYHPLKSRFCRMISVPSDITLEDLKNEVSTVVSTNPGFILSYKNPNYSFPFYLFEDRDLIQFLQILQEIYPQGLTLYVVYKFFEEESENISPPQASYIIPPEIIGSSEKPISTNPIDNNPFHNNVFLDEHTNEEEGDDDDTDVAAEDIEPLTFVGMPPSLKDPVMLSSSTSTSTRQSAGSIHENQFFDSKEELQVKLGIKCLEECFQFKPTTSNKTRFEARCMNKGCSWKIKAKSVSKGTTSFVITTLVDEHTCSQTHIYPNMRNASKKVVGSIVKNQLQDPARVYRGGDIVKDFNERFKCSITYSQAWRGKAYALEQLHGSHAESFHDLPAYCHNLVLANPGTVTNILTDESTRFEMLFVALGASV